MSDASSQSGPLYHINAQNKIGRCMAFQRTCPYRVAGGPHFSSISEAEEHLKKLYGDGFTPAKNTNVAREEKISEQSKNAISALRVRKYKPGEKIPRRSLYPLYATETYPVLAGLPQRRETEYKQYTTNSVRAAGAQAILYANLDNSELTDKQKKEFITGYFSYKEGKLLNDRKLKKLSPDTQNGYKKRLQHELWENNPDSDLVEQVKEGSLAVEVSEEDLKNNRLHGYVEQLEKYEQIKLPSNIEGYTFPGSEDTHDLETVKNATTVPIYNKTDRYSQNYYDQAHIQRHVTKVIPERIYHKDGKTYLVPAMMFVMANETRYQDEPTTALIPITKEILSLNNIFPFKRPLNPIEGKV